MKSIDPRKDIVLATEYWGWLITGTHCHCISCQTVNSFKHKLLIITCNVTGNCINSCYNLEAVYCESLSLRMPPLIFWHGRWKSCWEHAPCRSLDVWTGNRKKQQIERRKMEEINWKKMEAAAQNRAGCSLCPIFHREQQLRLNSRRLRQVRLSSSCKDLWCNNEMSITVHLSSCCETSPIIKSYRYTKTCIEHLPVWDNILFSIVKCYTTPVTDTQAYFIGLLIYMQAHTTIMFRITYRYCCFCYIWY